MQDKIALYRPETVTYGLGEIRDGTKAINVGTREMFATAFAQLHTRNNLVALFVPPYTRIAGDGSSLPPIDVPVGTFNDTTFIISGSISSSDKDVSARQFDAGVSIDRSGAGISRHARARVISVDTQAVVSRDNMQWPGAASSNSITVVEQGTGSDASLGFDKFGMTFATVASRNESEGRAVRTLLELASIEMVGKTLHVPYWGCLGGDQLQAEGAAEVELLKSDWLAHRMSSGRLDIWIEDALIARGYAAMPPTTKEQRERVIGRDDVIFGAARQLALADLRMNPEQDDAITTFNALMAADKGPLSPLPLQGLRVEHQPAYRSGQTYQLKVQPSHAAHISCFVRDSAGKTSRFFPNPYQNEDVAQFEQPITVPDGSRVALRALRAPGGPMEEILCVASTRRFDQASDLAKLGAALTTLPVASMNELETMIAKSSTLGFKGAYRFFVNVR